MNEHELFQKSFSTLHASDDTLQKVMSRAQSGKRIKGISKRIVVLAAVFSMLFSTALVGYATKLLTDPVAVLTPAENPAPVLDYAFGDKISTQKPNLKGGNGETIIPPDMERIPIDLTEATKLIGNYVCDVDGVLTIGENTFTLKNFLVDETGCGILTWTVENPNGVVYRDSGYGEVYFPAETPFCEPSLRHLDSEGREKTFSCMANALLSKNEEGTKLELLSYFGTFGKYEIGDRFAFQVVTNDYRTKKQIQFTPTECIPVKTMTAAEGMQLKIANQSLTLEVDSNDLFRTTKVVISFKDGTQYCVEDEDENINNTTVAFSRSIEDYDCDALTYLFNRLIDTNEVSSVSLTAQRHRKELVGEESTVVIQQETYVFYP